MRVDFLGLEAFLCIAERGSFFRAAAHLNLSQTALSHRIRKLEQNLGLKLLSRTTRQVSLTSAGRELLPRARRIMDQIDNSFSDMRALGSLKQEQLSVACLPTLATTYLPTIIQEFLIDYPDIELRIFDHSASHIEEHVRNGDVEFGITIISLAASDFDITPLTKEPFVLVCPANHELTANAEATWDMLKGRPLVRVGQQSGNRVILDDALGARREEFDWRFEARSVATALSMVRAGIGLSVLPAFVEELGNTAGLAFRPLKAPAVARTLGILTRSNVPLSPAAEAMKMIVQKHLAAPRAR